MKESISASVLIMVLQLLTLLAYQTTHQKIIVAILTETLKHPAFEKTMEIQVRGPRLLHFLQ